MSEPDGELSVSRSNNELVSQSVSQLVSESVTQLVMISESVSESELVSQ